MVATERSALPLASRHILVVDDQPSIRGILEVALSEAGARVRSAGDGDAALRAVESEIPDIILLDLVMPGMSGWDLLKALRASSRTAGVPVILQTSAEDFPSFDRAKKQGIAAFLSKPFRLHEVIETCRRVLEGARPLQGTSAREEEGPAVQVRDSGGNVIAAGHLLDAGPSGAQVALASPLALAQRVTLSYNRTGDVAVTVYAEVRWITQLGGRYHHGFSIRRV